MVNGIHLSSCYDRLREAQIQAELIPAESPQAYVYGLATGDLPQVLLDRPQLKQLTLVLMNLAVARASLSFFDHGCWLSDSRIILKTAEEETEVRSPFACAPACLYLADDKSARLRDLLQLELATPFIQRKHKWLEPKYLARLAENEALVARDADVAELFSRIPGQKIVIAGAGPSLANQYSWLREKRDQFLLIAVDTALRSLSAAGVVPDVVVSQDFSPTLFQNAFSGLPFNQFSHSILVYFPLVATKIPENWPGKRMVAYTQDAVYRDICEKYPRAELFSSGSVIHPAVDLAVKMGGKQLYLCGADFSFNKNQSHVSGAGVKIASNSAREWVLNGRGEKVVTTPNFRGYLRDLERYIGLHPEVEFFNTSLEGAKIVGTQYWAWGS